MLHSIKFLLILIYLLLGYSIYYCSEMKNIDEIFIQKLIIQNKECQLELKECQQYNVFKRTVFEIGERPYSKDYDCYDHSQDLQSALRKLDIESSILINSGRNHAWLGVWIESTEGNFISPDNNFKILEIR